MRVRQLVPDPAALYRDFVYDTLGELRLNLAVDVGAADGAVTRRLASICGPSCRVVAYEPFPTNFAMLTDNTSDLAGVDCRNYAVGASAGTATFFVGYRVQAHDRHDDRIGFSATGQLPRSRIDWLKQAGKVLTARWRGRRGARILRVPTVTLDDEFRGETIDFLKVDVQGAEANVLRGARNLVDSGGVKVLYLEWFGDEEVLRLLPEREYSVYDTTYLGGSRRDDPTYFTERRFDVVRTVTLSTGRAAFEMVYTGDENRGALLRRANVPGVRWLQTDLIVAHRSVETHLVEAVQARLGAVGES